MKLNQRLVEFIVAR